jgi:hypothetical protein
MTDRWSATERIFLAALERPVEARAAFVAEACGNDDALRREVQSLLDAGSSTGDQGAAPGTDRRSRSAGAVRTGSARAGVTQSPAHRHVVRTRGERRPLGARSRAGRRRDAGRAAGPRAGSAEGGLALGAADRRCAGCGARKGHRPSRLETRPASIKKIVFELLDVGAARQPTPLWNLPPVAAGDAVSLVSGNNGRALWFDIDSTGDASRVSVAISFVDDAGRGGLVSAIAPVQR